MAKVMNLGSHGFTEENNGKKTPKYCKHYKSIKYD